MEITLDGDTMTIKSSSLMRTTEYSFKLGEEYDEKMPSTTIKVPLTALFFHLNARANNKTFRPIHFYQINFESFLASLLIRFHS